MIIGLQVRHYKAYKNINFIPIGNEHNFVAYSGENGAGKSSILEALDTFLNNKNWLLTKQEKSSDSYICPLFLIPKEEVKRMSSDFENISNFFWNLEKKDKADKFFEIRNSLSSDMKDSHYLIFLGENYDKKLEIPFGKSIMDSFKENLDEKFSEKNFLKELKSIYSYVYIPVEIDSEQFTKIETVEMQKIFNKEIIDEIKKTLKQKDIDTINANLDAFVKILEEKLEGNYFYDTGDESTKKLTQKSLVDTILQIYFKKRVLMKGSRENTKISRKMSELSAGEKRESLINLVYVFLKEVEKRNSIIIIGIDEPENSLHTSICYEQFEKLKIVSKNAQVLITTHWYGFLPIVDKGLVHFLKSSTRETAKGTEEIIEFYQKADLFLYPYQTKNIPKDFSLKSTNDLVQSIFHSLKAKDKYNWLICEGPSDQLYLEYFLHNEKKQKKLQIIPVGGIELVKKFYKYLALPISENIQDNDKGKVFCLTDTDTNMRKNDIDQDVKLKNSLILKRLADNGNNETVLIKYETEEKQNSIDIEKSLNPTIFIKTLKELGVDEKYLTNEGDIQDINGNTTKENLRNFEIDNYFSNEETKNIFAKKYVEVMSKMPHPESYIPNWIVQLREFYN
jgi:predicted ATP-dependent endonuclease of OLD family